MSAWKSRWSRVRFVKTAGGELDAVDALERQGVRRHFHHAGAAAGVDHLAHEATAARALPASSAWRRTRAIADAVGDRAHQSAAACRPLEDRAEQVAGRRLAVGAGDARRPASRGSDDRRTPPRAAPGRAARRSTTIHGTSTAVGAGLGGDDRLPRRRRSPAGANAAPSALSPRSATNTVPRADAPRIVRHAGAGHVEPAASSGRGDCASPGTRLERAQQIADGHGFPALAVVVGHVPFELAGWPWTAESIGAPAGRHLLRDDARAMQAGGDAEARQHTQRFARAHAGQIGKHVSRWRSTGGHDLRRLGRASGGCC